MRYSRPIQTRFRYGSATESLSLTANGNSPVHYAKARRRPFPLRGIGLRQLVDAWFQVLLTPLLTVLFIIQSPYLSTIGHDRVFSLGEWSPQLQSEFHGIRPTLERQHNGSRQCCVRDYHPVSCDFPDTSAAIALGLTDARNPGTNPGLGCSAFARHY